MRPSGSGGSTGRRVLGNCAEPRDPRCMARPLRVQFPGATYHVTNRGNEQRPIFRSDDDYAAFLAFLAEAVRRFGWSVSAWVLMTNHFHLVIQTPSANLSEGMHWLETSYATWFNRRHSRSGHLFQGRYKSILVEDQTYLTRLLRYVVLNPVRANMVAQPEDYAWSSYRATAGLEDAPTWLDVAAALALFPGDGDVQRSAYRQYVLEMVGKDDPLWAELQHGIFLGSAEWAKEMRTHVESKPRSTDHPIAQRTIGRPEMAFIIDAVATAASTTADEIRKKRGHPLRSLVAWLGWYEGFHTLSAIAATLRLRSAGHMSRLVRRCEAALGCNADLLKLMNTATAALRPATAR